MNSSAAADLSGQEGPHGAIRAGLPSPLLDRLRSVCQRCSLNRPSSCRNPKVIYTIWLQNICFTNRPVIKGLSAPIRMWGRKINPEMTWGFFSSSLPHFSLVGDWHPSSLSCLLLSSVPRVRTGIVIMPWSSVLLSVGYTAQCKPNGCHCTLRHRVVLMNCASLPCPCSSAPCTLRWFICSTVWAGGGECWWNVIWEGLA